MTDMDAFEALNEIRFSDESPSVWGYYAYVVTKYTPAEGTASMDADRHYMAFILDTVTGKTEPYELRFYDGEDLDAAWRKVRTVVTAMNESEPVSVGERFRITNVLPAPILGS